MLLFPEATTELIPGEPIVITETGANCNYGSQEIIQCPKSIRHETWFGIECWVIIGNDGKAFYAVGPESAKAYKVALDEIVRNIRAGNKNKLTKRPYSWADYYVIKEKMSLVAYPYATTFHKSQGSTYENIWLDTNSVCYVRDNDDKARMLYTACTRPRSSIILSQ